jgi:hypothetical protein
MRMLVSETFRELNLMPLRAPQFWAATRASLPSAELNKMLSPIFISANGYRVWHGVVGMGTLLSILNPIVYSSLVEKTTQLVLSRYRAPE